MNIVDQYARTLVQAATEKDGKEFNLFFDNFVGLLKQKKHYKSLPSILRSVERLSGNKDSANKTIMIVREAALAGQYTDIVKQHADIFCEEYDVVEEPGIVGGYVIKNRTNLLDGSYRTGLMNLYKKLVS